MKRFFLILLLIFLHTAAIATESNNALSQLIDVEKNYENTIATQGYYLLESDKALNLQQIQQADKEGKFRYITQDVPSFPYNSPAVWLKFNIDNHTSESQLRRLIIDTPWIDYIDMYVIDAKGKVSLYRGGDERAIRERAIKSRMFIAEHPYQPGISEVYIRVQVDEPLMLPVYFYRVDESIKYQVMNAYHYGILYGVITGLLFFNLLLYLSIKQKRYLYYVFYLAMYLLMVISYASHGFFYLWKDAFVFQKWVTTISITLYSTAGVLFALAFLRVKKVFPSIYKAAIYTVFSILLIQFFLILFGIYGVSVLISILYVTLFSLFTFGLAVLCYRKGHRDAMYYLVATIATLIGSVVAMFSVIGIVPYTYVIYHLSESSVAFDAILLSIALAEQIRRAEKEKMQAQQLARIDRLTHLGNRLDFEEQSQEIWDKTQINNLELSFIMLDLDHFKNINDQYGHAIGDEVLKDVSAAIQEVVRDSDMLVRWGGEEFAIILPGTALSQACMLAERIRKHIQQREIKVADKLIRVTASLGVAQRTATSCSMSDLFSEADKQLYQAKQAGRNQVSC